MSVFALEQAGAERFLGDQRFPRNRLWLAKVGGWLAGTMIVATIVAVAAGWLLRGHRFAFDDWTIQWLSRDLVLALLGFSAGQLFGIHDRRLPVTAFLTLLLVTPLAAAWYAPLFGGGPAWHFAAVPILFLAARRFELRGWTAGRLDGAAHWIRCGLVVLVGFAWTGLVLWHRTAEVPDVGEPFVAAESPTETPIERARNHRIAESADQAQLRVQRLRIRRDDGSPSSWYSSWHEPGIELGQDPSMTYPILIARVLASCAPHVGFDGHDRDDYFDLRTEAFGGDWATALRRDIVDDRHVPIRRNPETFQVAYHLKDAARLYYVKSALILSQRRWGQEWKPEEVLDEFAMSLVIARYCSRYGSLQLGTYVQQEMLEAAETMVSEGLCDRKLCRGMLALLNHHAREMPSFSDLIMSAYANTNPSSAQWIAPRNRDAGLVAILLDAPFETIRSDRLERAFCRGLLRADEQNTLFLHPLTRDDLRKRDNRWFARYLALATLDCSAEEWSRILSHQSFDGELPLFRIFQRDFDAHARSVARLDALRLACAAALFPWDHGRDLKSLAELAPKYFATPPKCPFTECEFVYRESRGEGMKRTHGDAETWSGHWVAPGTGIIELPCLPTLKIAVPTIR